MDKIISQSLQFFSSQRPSKISLTSCHIYKEETKYKKNFQWSFSKLQLKSGIRKLNNIALAILKINVKDSS
jgi:hypothetical protein